MVAAWNAEDRVAFKESFAPDIDFVDQHGSHSKGCAGIDWDRQRVFDSSPGGSKIISTVAEIRPIRPGVAVAFLIAHLIVFDGDMIREGKSRPMIVFERKNGKWQICAFQNTRVVESGA
jgi:uncharacterized protein (TIGR02246 family)